jgi:hypothetical protein
VVIFSGFVSGEKMQPIDISATDNISPKKTSFFN